MKMKLPQASNDFWAAYGAIFFGWAVFQFLITGKWFHLPYAIIMAAFGHYYAGGCISWRQARALQAVRRSCNAAGDDEDGFRERFTTAFAEEGYELAGRDAGGIFVNELNRRK